MSEKDKPDANRPKLKLTKNAAKGPPAPSLPANATLRDKAFAALSHCIVAENITLNVSTKTYNRRGGQLIPEEMGEYVWTHHPYLPARICQLIAKEWIATAHGKAVDNVRDKMLTAPPTHAAAEELEKLLKLCVHAETKDDRFSYYVTIMRQLIWQVKRRLRNQHTWRDVMPVIVGKRQGTGKSSVVNKLAAPLDLLYMPDADFGLFADKFRIGALNRFYLVRLDEMDRARGQDVQLLKRVITSEVIQGRAMRSETERVLQRNASFLGKSNESNVDDIQDTTGMRRFAEIQWRDTQYTEDWGREVRRIDFPLIWACESGEDENAPIQAHSDTVDRYQSELRTRSDFETWCDEMLEEADETTHLRNKEAYESYVGFSRKPWSIQRFAREMAKLYGDPIRPNNKVTFRGVKFSSEGDDTVGTC